MLKYLYISTLYIKPSMCDQNLILQDLEGYM